MDRYLATILAIVISTGCASTAIPVNKASDVPSDRVYIRQAASQASTTLVFVKDEGAWASFGYHQIFVDGKLAASIKTGERFTLKVDEGEHVLGILPVAFTSSKEESALGYATTNIDQSVKAKQTYYYRILVDGDNSSRIQRFVPDLP